MLSFAILLAVATCAFSAPSMNEAQVNQWNFHRQQQVNAQAPAAHAAAPAKYAAPADNKAREAYVNTVNLQRQAEVNAAAKAVGAGVGSAYGYQAAPYHNAAGYGGAYDNKAREAYVNTVNLQRQAEVNAAAKAVGAGVGSAYGYQAAAPYAGYAQPGYYGPAQPYYGQGGYAYPPY